MVVVGGVGLVGCAGGDETRPDATVYGRQCMPGGSFNLNGRAAVLGNLAVHVNASGLVEVDTAAELVIAMNVEQTGTSVRVVAEACAIKIPDVPIQGQDRPIQFEVQSSTIASVDKVVGSAELSSATETCASFKTQTFLIAIGAHFDPQGGTATPVPAADSTGKFAACSPLDATCKLAIGSNCACDQEGDGKPGATLLARNVPAVNLDQVYVALRTQFSLDGKVFSSDAVEGNIKATIEQGILGCRMSSGEPCNPSQVSAVKNLNPQITQQPGKPSHFFSVRVPDGMTCTEILAKRDELFPR